MSYGMRLKAQRNLCHGQFCILPWHRDGCGFPTTKGFCLMKQWKLTEENVSVAVEAVLCANTTLLLREVLNAGWHRAASPVSKFRISSHPTPEIINSGSCSQPLPLICGACPAFLSAVTQTHCAVPAGFLAANVSAQESAASLGSKCFFTHMICLKLRQFLTEEFF